MAAWELIIDGTLAGAANMAVDAALLGEVERFPGARTVVRFYGWRGPTISLGRNQKVENALDVDYCRTNGIDIVHRPTGGRAVLHDDELTYAVISNDSSYFGDTIYGNYRRVFAVLCLRHQHYRGGHAFCHSNSKNAVPALGVPTHRPHRRIDPIIA